MVVLNLEGIAVDFPKDPYPCQEEYMKRNIRALVNGSNALLESPTGTGKTLCLLCSTLAWQQTFKAPVMKIEYSSGPLAPASAKPSISPSRAVPTIVYASRTHSQLAQVMSELRVSSYRPVATVLGSREQLCVNPKVSKLRGNGLNRACNSLSANRGCSFKNNLDSLSKKTENSMMDIEELVHLGRTDKVCPYFFARDVSTTAELVLVPYNYLLDRSIRATLNVQWQNSVIIFDEAHNLEQVASDAASFTITSTDIAACIEELQRSIIIMQNNPMPENDGDSGGGPATSEHFMKNALGVARTAVYPSIPNTAQVLRALFALEAEIDAVPLSLGIGKTPSRAQPGEWLALTLEKCGLLSAMASKHIDEIRRCSNLLIDEMQEVTGGAGTATEPRLTMLAESLQKVFQGRSLTEEVVHSALDFRVFICEEETHAVSKTSGGVITSQRQIGKRKRILNYWAFSPGIAMVDLKRLGVRSIILTSGTLSPLESFKEDMKLSFPIELENSHVIQDKQVWIGAVGKGPTGKQLKSTFEVRETDAYKNELGQSILSICRAMIGKTYGAPELKGGILVFFPSYGVLESTAKFWQQSSIWTDLEAVAGRVVMEPRGSQGAQTQSRSASTSRDRSDPVKPNSNFVTSRLGPDPSAGTDDGQVLGGVIAEFEDALSQDSGRCILLAVCRGKVSEGIDFRDDKGRVVIITGIPYAPHLDPWVQLKKQYLDDKIAPPPQPVKLAAGGAAAASNVPSYAEICSSTAAAAVKSASLAPRYTGGKRLSGQAWYNQSASRAVNQAIGRIIRHRNDWGAVFLLDERFQSSKQQAELSSWMKGRVKNLTSMMQGLNQFRTFISEALSDSVLMSFHRCTQTRPARQMIHAEASVPTFRAPIQLNSEITRQRTINEADLEVVDGSTTSFVDPSMLLTQSTSTQRGGLFSGLSADEEFDSMISRLKGRDPPKMKTEASSASVDSNKSLVQIFSLGKLASTTKSSGAAGNAISSSFERPSLATAMASGQGSVLKNTLSRSSSSSGLSSVGSSPMPTAGLAASKEAWFLGGASSQSSKAISKQFSFGSLISSSQTIIDKETAERNELRSVVDELKSLVTKEKITEFKTLVATAKISGCTQVSNVQEFVMNLIELFSQDIAANSTIDAILIRLKILLPPNHADLFGAMMNKSLRARRARHDASSKRRLDDSDGIDIAPLPSQSTLSAAPLIDGVKIVSRPSARAMALLEASSGTMEQAGLAKPTDSKSMLDLLHAECFNVSKKPKADSVAKAEITSKKLQCPVCLSTPTEPCAARCGHVCCRVCWERTLSARNVCPICRAPTTQASLTHLIIKA